MRAAERITYLLKLYPSEAGVYATYEPKKNGGLRPIVKPNKVLNKWLKDVNDVLSKRFYDWPSIMHGGIKKRSYVSFAKPHIGKKIVVTIDIRDCFNSISAKDISETLERLELAKPICEELASRLSYKGRLPQGFATSNYLSNLFLMPALRRIEQQLRPRKIALSNYVDDIAISGRDMNVAETINDVILELSRIGLAVQKSKIRVMYAHQRQVICGLVVNKRLAVSAELKMRLFSEVTNGEMSKASLRGWVSNLNMIDPKLSNKLDDYATVRGVKKSA